LAAAFQRIVMKDTLGVLLAGGAGERLYPLTRDRAKPAVTFGGIYRIIDVTLSNCINSDLRRVYILTQYKALSLNRHIREGWNIVGREMGEFVEVLPPMKRVSDQWYQGTADAVYQNIYSIGSEQPKHVLILSGDHIYKMNYGLMLKQHLDSGADVTLGTIQINLDETYRFGVIDVDPDNRVVGFQEKPTFTTLRSPYNPEKVSASMGIYLFNTDVLIPILLKDAEDEHSSHDFGKDILPKMMDDYRVYSWDFVDENKKEALYWRDVGTLEAYYEANMDMVSVSPVFNLYDNQIEVLPASPSDDRLRIQLYRTIYGFPGFQRYAMPVIKPIRIIVKNGHVTLEGVVDNEADKNLAGMRANGVSGIFSVANNLAVAK
jgi:glucose-1-phosphate adenylyltransferase